MVYGVSVREEEAGAVLGLCVAFVGMYLRCSPTREMHEHLRRSRFAAELGGKTTARKQIKWHFVPGVDGYRVYASSRWSISVSARSV